MRVEDICDESLAVNGSYATVGVSGRRWLGKRFNFKVSHDEVVISNVEG